MDDKRIYRILDANINRAREGIRVIEESLRFVFQKKEFAEKLRGLRHEVSHIPLVLKISSAKLFNCRESETDIGKKRIESDRKDLQEIIASNFSRVEESVRVLEEYSRIINPKATGKIKKIRFDLYALQKKIQLSLYRKNLAYMLGFYVITDEEIAGKSHAEIVSEAVKGGANTIQLRDKKSSDDKIYSEAKKIRSLIPQDEILFIVNDRVDIAVVSEADGVHLGKCDLPIYEARKMLGEDKIIGISCGNVEEAVKAEKLGADYVALGPIFPTNTKQDVPSPLGTRIIKEVKKRISIPVVAIGGIKEDNMKLVLEVGADSIAMISEVLRSDNIATKVRSLKKKFLNCKPRNKK